MEMESEAMIRSVLVCMNSPLCGDVTILKPSGINARSGLENFLALNKKKLVKSRLCEPVILLKKELWVPVFPAL